MIVKEGSVWGIDSNRALTYGRSYRVRSVFVYLLDILFIGICVSVMYSAGSAFGEYFTMMIVASLAAFLALNVGMKDELLMAYRFVRRYGKCEVKCRKVRVDADDMRVVLAKASKGKRKLKANDTIANYITFLLNICRYDYSYATKYMKLLDTVCPDDARDGEYVYIYYAERADGKRGLVELTQEPLEKYEVKATGSTLGIDMDEEDDNENENENVALKSESKSDIEEVLDAVDAVDAELNSIAESIETK